MDRNITQKVHDKLFKNYAKTVWVYLKASNVKGPKFDSYLNVGMSTTSQSPEPVKAVVRQLTGDSLVARELGLVNIGSIELIIKSQDVGLFEICDKIKYDDSEYSTRLSALGNKVQIFKHLIGYYKVVLFKVGN